MRPSRIVLALLAVLLATAPAFAGSPFYLTIERSFASGESPQVRLDFADEKTPLVVRILRPKNVDRFLDGQLNISRAYEEPLAAINPGHYVLQGLNHADSPLSGLRSLLDPDFRLSFKNDVFRQALREPRSGPLVTAPAEATDAAPEGFEVVREGYIDLQKGGETTPSLYGWDNYYGGFRYQVRQLSLDPLPDGLYLVQGVQDRSEAQALLQVSSLSMQVKQSTAQLLVRVVDRGLKPVEGATVSYRDGRGKWQELSGRTDAHGEIEATDDGRFDGKLLVHAVAPGGRAALTETDFLPATSGDPSVFIVTDRPIFKPGETFFFKGTVRTRENGELVLPKTEAANATVHLLRQDGTEIGAPQSVPISAFASFSGSFELDPAEAPGLYRLAAEIDDKRYAGEFRVRDYVKPTFYLELIDRDPAIRPGEDFHLSFRAKRYAGGVPQGVRYEVFVYRKRFEAPAWVAEAGAGLEAGYDYTGEVRSSSALSEPQRLYSSVEARVAAGAGDAEMPWTSAPEIDADGTGAIEIKMPAVPEGDANRDWIYSVMVRAMDRAGSQAVLTENLYMTQAEAAVASRFDPTVSQGNEDLRLLLRTTYPDGQIAPGAAGHVDLTLDSTLGDVKTLPPIAFLSDEKGHAVLPVSKPPSGGRLRAVAVLEGLGEKKFARPFTAEPVIAIVAAGDGAAVVANRELELHAERTVLSPGERAKVLALLPVGWGTSEEGEIWETLAGTKIFGTRASSFRGRSHWFDVEARPEYGTGFYQTVTVPVAGGKYQEQTIGFRVVPVDKRLAITIEPSAEVAEPLKPFTVAFEVRDASGGPAANAELSVNIVDRAVYAVQPEFRPSVLDFFYPLPRLNLGTFYSDELQGYGYAAELQRRNFRLAALKANVQVVKRDMRDTAGWFPHVVTDARGRATVTAEMPANITEWLVTAIAVDRNGRAGEGKGGFRSSTDIAIEPRVPQFLRDGDVIDGSIELQNHTPNEATVDLQVRASGGTDLEGQADWTNIALPPKGATTVPARIATVAGNGKALLEMRPMAVGVRTGGPSGVDIALRPAAMRQVFSAARDGSRLAFVLPTEADSGELQVMVLSGLLGASLRAAAQLVEYPWGCTEQLAHSTMPNLLLLGLVESAGLEARSLEPLHLATSVEQARSNARAGVQKLVEKQKSDGGFGLWPGDSEEGFTLTLIAARVLHLASEVRIAGAERAFDKARAWLESQAAGNVAPASSDLGLYEIQVLTEIGLGSAINEISAVQVKDTLADEQASVAELTVALNQLDQRRYEYWFGNRLDEIAGAKVHETAAATLAARLKARLGDSSKVDYRPNCADFAGVGFCYGDAAAIAGIYEALDRSGALDDDLRALLTAKLLQSFQDGWWRSTFNTAEVLFRLRGVLAREVVASRNAAPSKRVVHTAAGTTFDLTSAPGGFLGRFEVERPQDLLHLEIEGMKEGEVATASMGVRVPFRAVRSLENGLSVRRTLLVVEGNKIVPLEAGRVLERGTVVVSQITVERPGPGYRWMSYNPTPSDFVVVEDGIPSIAETIDDDRPYLADAGIQPSDDTYWSNVKQTQRYPDRTERVVSLRLGGRFTTYQVWRAAFSGTASMPPARAYDMYDDGIAGNDLGGTIAVK